MVKRKVLQRKFLIITLFCLFCPISLKTLSILEVSWCFLIIR